MPTKRIRYLVHDSDDNFIGEWTDVSSELTLQREINNAACAVEAELGRNELTQFTTIFNLVTEADELLVTEDDDILVGDVLASTGLGSGTDLDLNYNIEINTYYGGFANLTTEADELLVTEADEEIIVEDGAPEGYEVFKGYITDWELDFGESDTVKITMLNHGTEIQDIIMMDGTDTKVVFNSYDPSDIAKAVIDYAQTQGAKINYDTNSIEDTGTTVSVTFNLNTIAECLDTILKLCPSDWYWTYHPGTDLYSLKSRPASTSRNFTNKLDVSTGTLRRSIMNLVNEVYFTGGGDPALLVKRVDSTSQTNWRRGLSKISDQRVTVQATAELIADSEIDRYKNPTYIGSISINGNHPTAIETIDLGELVGFINYGALIDDLELQVVGLTYNIDTVDLKLDRILPAVTKRIEDIKRNLDTMEQQNNPDAPI